MKTYIGCSGYYYQHWKSNFYPDTLPKNRWLAYYAEHFNAVEINNTFYRMPVEKTVTHWYDLTPASFVFTVKGFRFITHQKKLTVDRPMLESLHEFQKTAACLKEKLGSLLWQLPGSFVLNLARLEQFCAALSPEFRHIFEFRHASWYVPEVYAVLEKYRHGLCTLSAPGNQPQSIHVVSGIAYLRFHGKNAWYHDNYSNTELKAWKRMTDGLPATCLFAYFNNDFQAFAVNNARYFASLLAPEHALPQA